MWVRWARWVPVLLSLTVLAAGVALASYGAVARKTPDVNRAEELALAAVRHQAAYPDEKRAHWVTITQPFYFGKYEVTQEQYYRTWGENPSATQGKNLPVEQVSWNDAQRFCQLLGTRFKRAVRLPTEAEWEWACRTGTRTACYSGDTKAELARVAWYQEDSGGAEHPVGQKVPNAFGLYDLHGNVWEWCQDWYDENYYAVSPPADPPGPEKGAFRILRGGSWSHEARGCRSANRCRSPPGDQGMDVGFRVVVLPAAPRLGDKP
jgi:formylglycine-generating enzyme required for sulfatase activity